MFREKLLKVKEYDWCKRLVYNLAWALFGALVIIILLVNIMSLRLDEVLTNSMYPVFSDRDVVVVMKQKEYKVGDIIEFKEGNRNTTHRLVEITEDGKFIAQGEHDGAGQQVVDPSNVRGKVIAIWFNGRDVYQMIHDNYFMILVILVGAWILSITISGENELKKHNILNV